MQSVSALNKLITLPEHVKFWKSVSKLYSDIYEMLLQF